MHELGKLIEDIKSLGIMKVSLHFHPSHDLQICISQIEIYMTCSSASDHESVLVDLRSSWPDLVL